MSEHLPTVPKSRWIDSTIGDVRFAMRHFARKPLAMATIVLVLSLGIGVHSAVFSVIQAITMRPAPGVPRDNALVRVRGKEQLAPGSKWFPRGFSYTEFRELAEHREIFAALAGWTLNYVTFNGGGQTDDSSVQAQFVTGNYFTALGVRPVLGTLLPPTARSDESEPELAAVIGYVLWQTAFGGSADVLGKTVRVNDIPLRIVGVAPPRFNGATQTPGSRMLWVPLSARAPIMRTTAQSLIARDSTLLQSFARLASHARIEQANATVRVVTNRAVRQMAPQRGGGARDADVVPLRGDTNLPANDDAIMIASVFGSMALLILLVACTNVSALVVGAAAARRQEIAIRLSLGASRQRLVRQLLTESTLLAVTGGALGLAMYWAIVRFIATRLPEVDLTPDIATVAFTVCFALVTGMLFGLSPALHATRRGVADVLKDSGASTTSRSRLQRAFVVAQIVFTQPLLVGLAMMLAVVTQDGLKQVSDSLAEHVVLLRFDLYSGPGSYQKKSAELAATMQRVAMAPGVERIVSEPSGAANADFTVRPEDRSRLPQAAKTVSVHVEATSPGYFSLINVPIIRGRDLEFADSAARELPVIIGSDLAQELWGSSDPIGKRFTQKTRYADTSKDAIVIGVYDARFPTTRGAGVRVYAPQDHRFSDSYLIRTTQPAQSLIAPLRAIVRTEIPNISIGRLQTLAQVNAENRRDAFRVSAAAAAGGVVALLLASIGLYGVVALALGQRRREIGIRMALGARPQQVVGMLFSSGVRLSAIGLVLGLPLSLVALRVLAGMIKLPEINMMLVGVAIASVVVAVASFATWLPARQAAMVDPAVTLRVE